MPVNKITADQFVTQLNTSIQSRNPAHDVDIGPIADIITHPTAEVLEQQNDRIRLVSQLILLDQSTVFNDSDVESFVKNEELLRNPGGRSSGTVIFSRASAPAVNLVVQENFPIASSIDESTGETVIFVTTESSTLFALSASSFFNIQTQRYELEVAVISTVAGKIGEVGPNKIIRPLRPLDGFDKVFNRNRTSSVNDRETNNDLIERYKISILGTQLAVRNGLRLVILSKFPDSGDVLVVNAGDPLITRSGESGSAVDVFVTGSQSIIRQDTKTFVGLNQLIVLNNQPVLNITNIPGFTFGTDYVFVTDVSGISNSIRAQNGIKFIPGGTSPTVGSAITIDYEQNILIPNIQSFLDDADNDVGGQDALIRSATQVNIIFTARLIPVTGFSFTTVSAAVADRLLNFINAFRLGNDVELSDLQAEARTVTGVDNFIITVLARVGGSGVADIIITQNEFARILSGDITIIP